MLVLSFKGVLGFYCTDNRPGEYKERSREDSCRYLEKKPLVHARGFFHTVHIFQVHMFPLQLRAVVTCRMYSALRFPNMLKTCHENAAITESMA